MPDAVPKVEVVLPVKPWWRSKTIWFNALTALLMAIDVVAANLGLLQPLVPPAYWPLVVAVITLGNLWLRAITTYRVSLRTPGEPS